MPFSQDASKARIKVRRKKTRTKGLFEKKVSVLRRSAPLFIGFTILIALIGGLAFFAYSPQFLIQSIQIKRDSLLIDSNKIYSALTPFFRRHIISVSKDEMEEIITEQFPEVESIELYRQWPNSVQIFVHSYQPIANVKIAPTGLTQPEEDTIPQEISGLINSKGYIIELNKQDPQFPVIVVTNPRKEYELHTQVIEQEALKSMLQSKNLTKEYFDVQTNFIEYFPVGREYHLFLDTGTTLWLDFTSPYEEQLYKIKRVLADIDFIAQPPQYIDLRIKDKLIYRK